MNLPQLNVISVKLSDLAENPGYESESDTSQSGTPLGFQQFESEYDAPLTSGDVDAVQSTSSAKRPRGLPMDGPSVGLISHQDEDLGPSAKRTKMMMSSSSSSAAATTTNSSTNSTRGSHQPRLFSTDSNEVSSSSSSSSSSADAFAEADVVMEGVYSTRTSVWRGVWHFEDDISGKRSKFRYAPTTDSTLQEYKDTPCQICGGMDEHNFLFCDLCDRGYHCGCLGLATVPTTAKWYCASCHVPATRFNNLPPTRLWKGTYVVNEQRRPETMFLQFDWRRVDGMSTEAVSCCFVVE
jgi:hypothetical protein